MTGRVQQRRSITASTVPTAGQMLQGEFLVNINPSDKKAYIKLSDDSVFEIAGASYALLASPALTGIPTVPTAAAGTTTTQAASTAFVATAFGDFLDEISYKEPVRVASTANIVIASALINASSIDGVTLATGDRVLLKDQSSAPENGIYVVVASGAASRSTDADVDAEVKSGLTAYVEEGTANGQGRYTLATANPIVVDTTALSFVKTAGSGTFTAGDGIDIAAGVISVDVTDLVGTGVEDDGANNIRLAAQGNGIAGGAGTALSVAADSTGGANLATAVNVSSNGLAIKIDNLSVVENGSNQLEVGIIDGGVI